MTNGQLNHTNNFNCSIDDLNSEYPHQCGIRCYTNNDDYSFVFKGVKFDIYGTKANGNHEFDVELDGKIIGTPDESNGDWIGYTRVFQSDILVYKEHRVRIINKNKQYEINKLTYWPSINTIRINSTSFTKTGSWIKESDGVGGKRIHKYFF